MLSLNLGVLQFRGSTVTLYNEVKILDVYLYFTLVPTHQTLVNFPPGPLLLHPLIGGSFTDHLFWPFPSTHPYQTPLHHPFSLNEQTSWPAMYIYNKRDKFNFLNKG